MLRLLLTLSLLPALLLPLTIASNSIESDEVWVKLYPTDESAWDSSFYRFKQRLDRAIEERDAEFLHGILDKNVYSSFGNDSGVDVFMTYYNVEDNESEVWTILKECLDMGGTFRYISGHKYFIAPYIFSRFPKEFDMYEYALVVGEAVPLYSSPDENAETIKRLSHDLVYAVYHRPGQEHGSMKKYEENGFIWVKTLMNEEGWIPMESFRCPLEHRVLFRQDDDTWRLTSLIEGD